MHSLKRFKSEKEALIKNGIRSLQERRIMKNYFQQYKKHSNKLKNSMTSYQR